MSLHRQLTQFGLTENEAKVYLATLELGETTVARISAKSGVERTSCYGVITDLKQAGLMATGRRGRKQTFFAESPKRLESILRERTVSLERLLPELLSRENAIDRKPRVRFYEEWEGIMDIYRETLDYPERNICMWMSEVGVWYDDEKFWKEFYIPARIEKKIQLKVIAPNTRNVSRLLTSDATSLRYTRTDARQEDVVEAEIMLYGTRHIAIISQEERIGLVLESEKLFKTLRGIFLVHWNSLGTQR